MITVEKDWWKDYFNDVYLITDARSISDEALTRRETDLIEKFLKLEKSDRILDLFGGQGRHSMELANRGYRDLTVLDYSPFLVKKGKESAKKEKRKIKFYRRDARSTKLKPKFFSAIFVMANSFGYFQDESDNIRVLKEIRRLLKKKGRLLLDLADADYVKRNLVPFSKHRASKDITVTRSRELDKDTIRVRETVISKKNGIIRDGFYCERLYTDKRIRKILAGLGFKDISIQRGVALHEKKQNYGFLTSRMLVMAKK